MPRIIREEMQDKDGNVHYLHTEDCVVWCGDGRSLRENMESVQFEEYETEKVELPDAETALTNIRKGKSWTELFSNIKAFCKGVVLISRVLDSENITEDGYLMSGKKCSELFQEVNANYVMLLDRVAAIETIQGNYATSQNGTYRSNATIYGRDSADFLITFPKPFKKTPSVVNVSGSYVYNDGKTYNTTWTLSVKSKTAASFVLTVNNLNGGGISSITINWSATE